MLGGVVQVAKIAVVVGLTALATDKLQKEYMTRQVQPPRLCELNGAVSVAHCMNFAMQIMQAVQVLLNDVVEPLMSRSTTV